MLQLSFDKYKNDPLKYAQGFLDEADEGYRLLFDIVRRAMWNQVMRSRHTDIRRADPNYRSAAYIPAQRRAIDSLVDTQMEMFMRGNPIIRAEASYPDNIPLGLEKEMDKGANRIEDYYDLAISSRYGALRKEMEVFFHCGAIFPYNVMTCSMDYKYRDVVIGFKSEIVTDDLAIPVGVKYVPDYGRRLILAYPHFRSLAPWQCRVDLKSRNWNREPDYFFEVEYVSGDRLYEKVFLMGGDTAKVKKLLGRYPSGAGGDNLTDDRPYYREYSLDNVHEDESSGVNTYRLVTGYFPIYDYRNGLKEMRTVVYVDGVNNDYALLYEGQYPYGGDDKMYITSFNNMLVGERYGLSDAEKTTSLQDQTNESWNLARDAARNLYPQLLIASEGWVTEPSLRPSSKWIYDFDRYPNRSIDNVAQYITPHNYPDFQMFLFGASEERLSQMIDVDTISGQVGLPERKTQTLGQDEMRQASALRSVARKTTRHIEAFEELLNVSLHMVRKEFLEGFEAEDLQFAKQPMKNIQKQDMIYDIDLGMPHVRSLSNREDQYLKIVGLIEESVKLMPSFVLGNPEAAKELIRKLWEAADMRGFEQIFADVGMESPLMGGQEGINQPIPSREIANG